MWVTTVTRLQPARRISGSDVIRAEQYGRKDTYCCLFTLNFSLLVLKLINNENVTLLWPVIVLPPMDHPSIYSSVFKTAYRLQGHGRLKPIPACIGWMGGKYVIRIDLNVFIQLQLKDTNFMLVFLHTLPFFFSGFTLSTDREKLCKIRPTVLQGEDVTQSLPESDYQWLTAA